MGYDFQWILTGMNVQTAVEVAGIPALQKRCCHLLMDYDICCMVIRPACRHNDKEDNTLNSPFLVGDNMSCNNTEVARYNRLYICCILLAFYSSDPRIWFCLHSISIAEGTKMDVVGMLLTSLNHLKVTLKLDRDAAS